MQSEPMSKKQPSLITENVPSVDYTMRITKDNMDWAGILAEKIGSPIQLATVNCTQTEYHGFVLVRSRFEKQMLNTLRELKKKKLVKEFDIESKDDQYLTVYVTAGEPRVCYTILRNKFELLTPVIVNKDNEIYRI